MKMINIKMNGLDHSVPAGITILDASMETRKLHQLYRHAIIPTLYYLKGINDVDDSGVCVVEVDGKLVNATTTRIAEGMEILTNSAMVVEARKAALSKILAIHHKDCINCSRSANCELQTLLHTYGFTDEVSLPDKALEEIDISSKVLVRDNNKCIRCKRCINVCAKVQAVSAIACTGEGLDAVIAPASPKGLASASCVNCGQCVAVCPVGALSEKDETEIVMEALADKKKFVIAEVAPSVRAALGEDFEFPIGVDVEGKIAAALRELGFDKVFDTKFSADLTVVEEANELVERIQNGGVLPLITSCCPAWIKYAEHFYADMLDNLSSCKSPQQMLGAVAKSYYADQIGVDKKDIVVVSIMPCTAKKFERQRLNECGAGVPDVDVSITTNELADMLKKAAIQLEALPDEAYDEPMGIGSGAGVVFGATGGVMEAALRAAVETLGGKPVDKLEFSDVRGMSGIKEAGYEVGERTVRVAVASGLANANALLTRIKNGEADYQFVEIMACPGGCVNGGGQPHHPADVRAMADVAALRAGALYANDKASALRKSQDNPAVKALYRDYLGTPGSEKARALLHTSYIHR